MKNLFVFLFVMFTMTISAQEIKTHTVQRGETIESIAEKYNVSAADITKANPDAAKFFYTGMKLKIPAASAKQKVVENQTSVSKTETGNTHQQSKEPSVNKGNISSVTKQEKKPLVNDYSNSSNKILKYVDAGYSLGFISPSEGKSQTFNAITLGATLGKNFNKIPNLFYFAKLNAQYSFYSKTEGIVENSFKMLSFNVSLGAAYAFDIPNSEFKIMPKAGINMRMSIGGILKEETSYAGITRIHKVNVFNETDMQSSDATWNCFNLGGFAGADIVYSERYILGLSYQMDFTNIAYKTSVNQINISLGYCF